jgi:hypothetical protein
VGPDTPTPAGRPAPGNDDFAGANGSTGCSVSAQTRAAITFRQPARNDDGLYESESAHEDRVTFDADGVWLSWEDCPPDTRTFVPFANIARIDYEPCGCADCKRTA